MLHPTVFLHRDIWRATLLCGISGYVDAIGYIELGGVFAANMTGNTVLLAIQAVAGEHERVLGYAITLATFLFGAVIATILRRTTRSPFAPLLLESAMLLASAVIAMPHLVQVAILAMAMGAQGAAMTRFGGTSLSTVVITGTMIRLADSLVERLGIGPSQAGPGIDDVLETTTLAWVGYGIGAAIGALALTHVRGPLIFICGVIVLLAIETAVTQRRHGRALV